MSDFVNFNKRSITLPAGCKDLIDVLRPHGVGLESFWDQLGTDLSHATARGSTVTGGLSEIEKYVRMAFGSRAHVFILNISPTDWRLTLSLIRVLTNPMRASVLLETNTPQEAAVRRFFVDHHMQWPAGSSTPSQFSPQLPVHLICYISPLPSDAVVLSGLASDLFRESCGLTDESELCYHHLELANPA